MSAPAAPQPDCPACKGKGTVKKTTDGGGATDGVFAYDALCECRWPRAQTQGAICAAGSCAFCGCTFRKPSDVMRHCCAAMQEATDAAKLRAENERLRELYENVTGNRERFGWTINHLLECEDALAESSAAHHAAGVAEGRAAMLREVVEWLRRRDGYLSREWQDRIDAADAIEARFPSEGTT